ncbi:hypothetical protein [Methanobrevibacter sp.]|uniref:Ig-like domain-containing protein n=1 Tax=Methanobrevibacter sp. TaxID=66852 RepID=UPI002A74D26F|nr:hypothetical protein [Methanobrevibacter sp.]MDY3096964.1 hypothetical protein [Methanobrevibacter sp.]
MKLKNKILVLSLFLVLICCIGAVSATEDINETITADSSIDEEDIISAESSVDEVLSDESDGSITTQNFNTGDESNTLNPTRTAITVSDWTNLRKYCQRTSNYEITLNGNSFSIGDQISFANSATIIGSSNSYITGGSTTKTPFINTNSALTLHFINVKFQNVNAQNLLELDGTVYLENCTFNNVQTATGHNSVIYNTNNLMYLTGCNITNCNTGYGAVTNYNSGSTTSVVMYVDDCKFINNSASVEPGAINNCGILYVNNSEFDGNHANWWAGAIHTHTNAQTEIENTLFKRNTAGWNGGALFTYSKLKIKNCTFEDNNCTTNNGGGAIGAYNYGSGYNITICSSRFNYNTNLCYAYTNISTTSVGRGGAISVLNGGYLTVCNCNFTGNYAKIGQAIAAATYTYENGTGGNPHIKICNNRFVNHTATGIDTVVITGNDYLFNNNVFINSYQNTHYTGTGNIYNAVATISTNPLRISLRPVLSATSSDYLAADEDNAIYVNISSEIEGLDGKSWETAYGGVYCFDDAVYEISNGGTIYLANGNYLHEDYDGIYPLSFTKNMTFIGQGSKTNLTNIEHHVYGDKDRINCIYTFINLTLTGKMFGVNSNFINCTIMGKFSVSEDFIKQEPRHIEEYGYAKTYSMNFDNCVFKDVTTDGSLVTLYKYGAVNFNNCTFKNIVVDSLVYRNDTTYFDEDGISFKNCNFTNSKFNGVVDSAANFDQAIIIEDCTYDGEVAVGTTEVNGHFYVNATKLKVVAVATQMNISSTQRGVVVIAIRDANGNAVSGVTVNYVINGENMTSITDENGTITISDLTNEVVVSAVFAGNENFLASNNTADFNFTIPKVATQLSCAGVTTYYNVGKNLVVTLKDANGNVLANKMVTVNFSGKTYTKVTDANGQIIFKLSATLLPKTYLTTITFAGDETLINSSVATKVVVKKATVKMAASAKTFKKSLKTKKYSITLKNNLGKVMKNTKVTLKIKGKTFSAYTNSKCVATFKITKLTKKGKYTSYVKYAGSKYYNALNKKVVITLK